MNQCLHWIQLSIAHETISTQAPDRIFNFQLGDGSIIECSDALNTASLLGRIPVDIIFAYNSVDNVLQMMLTLNETTENWRSLQRLGEIINTHKDSGIREKEALESFLEAQGCQAGLLNAISHLAETERHTFQNHVNGAAL